MFVYSVIFKDSARGMVLLVNEVTYFSPPSYAVSIAAYRLALGCGRVVVSLYY